MAGDQLKSTYITDLDSTPTIRDTSGQNAPGKLNIITATVTPTTVGLTTTASTYKMVRLKSTAKLKRLTLGVDGALDSSTGLGLDVGAYYSDATNDGTAVANQNVLIDADYFSANNTSFRSSAVADVNVLRGNQFLFAMRNKELWDALGLTKDPGGFIDIVVAVHTVATTAASAVLGMIAEYCD